MAAQKPDCFMDQTEADAKALEFLEAVAKLHVDTLPGVTIEHHSHLAGLADGAHSTRPVTE